MSAAKSGTLPTKSRMSLRSSGLRPTTPPLVLPARQNTQATGQSAPQKHSVLPKFGIIISNRHLIPLRGAYRDRPETRGERRWTRAASRGRLSRARRTRSRVRQNRVVLTPGVCASRLAVVQRSDRPRASVVRKATGAIVHRSPGRARYKPPNHCAGKAGCWASPVCRCASVLRAIRAQRTVGASRHPVFPAPSVLEEPDGSKARANPPRGC